ncbi:MAG: hypothetical protein LM564_03100 [Desulfurococcaceae archaeon]|nr:hypothetical protein [Desulfurococcaceae archaeon]
MRRVVLSLDEYRECLFFALRMWYIGRKTTLDWRRAGRRDIGDYISDHVEGKLAEIAFAKMLRERYGIEASVDLEVRPGARVINETDIKLVSVGGVRRRPRIRIDVKSTTPESKYLLIDAREFESRRYDAYVLVLVDLPRDHLVRFLADRIELPPDLRQAVAPLSSIEAVVAGFAYREDVETRGRLYRAGERLPDPENPRRKLVQLKVDNYGLPISGLRRDDRDWDDLVSKL